MSPSSIIFSTDIRSRIQASAEISKSQKQAFLAVVSYFTPDEIRELETLL